VTSPLKSPLGSPVESPATADYKRSETTQAELKRSDIEEILRRVSSYEPMKCETEQASDSFATELIHAVPPTLEESVQIHVSSRSQSFQVQQQ